MTWTPAPAPETAWTRTGRPALSFWQRDSPFVQITYWDGNLTAWDTDLGGTAWDVGLSSIEIWTKQ